MAALFRLNPSTPPGNPSFGLVESYARCSGCDSGNAIFYYYGVRHLQGGRHRSADLSSLWGRRVRNLQFA